ncbi:MAG: thioredoxin domain-containing protein [Desulfurococcales archaeon]|nr:thioredoxin domain-containing protein [Desulfurococcales archaeon]
MARLQLPKRGDLRLTHILAIFMIAAAATGWALNTIPSQTITPPGLNAELKEMISNKTCTAVMFWSPTCPVCERMLPHWKTLEPGEDDIGVADVGYNDDTIQLFTMYRITDTPTFLVLDKNGEVISKHVGAFPGPDPAKAMKDWIEESCSKEPSKDNGEPPRLLSSLQTIWPAAMVIAGIGIALSPCVAPLVVALGALGRGESPVKCAAASTLGLFIVAAGVSIALSVITGLVSWLRYAASLFAVMAGAYMIMGGTLPPVKTGSASCFGLGLLAAQCSLPLVAGAIALAGSLGVTRALASSILVTLGAGIGLAALYSAGGLLSRLTSNYKLSQQIAGAVLAAAGVVILWGW